MVYCKKVFALLCILLCFTLHGKCQTEIGFRVSPNVTSQPKVISLSPARIYGENRISFDAGVDYTAMFKSKPVGIRIAAGMGIVDHNYVFIAPQNAFGVMSGDGTVDINSTSENYLYNSLSALFVYRFNIKNISIETHTGVIKKFYHRSSEENGIGYAFNRGEPYDFDDPGAGPPDFLITIPSIRNRLHLDVPLGVGIKRLYSNGSSLTFGLVKNWNIQPIGKGSMFVQMYNQFYEGEFSPRSSFFGLDIRYGYSLNKKKSADKDPQDRTEKSGYKKAIFFELLGNGVVASFNYDIRLKKDRNDGFGLRAGIGKGEFYPTETATNTGRFTTLPLSINYIVGGRRSGLETGIGITPRFTFDKVSENSNVRVGGFLNVGYRYQPMKEGLVFRAALTPFVGGRPIFQTWAGASIGYGFK